MTKNIVPTSANKNGLTPTQIFLVKKIQPKFFLGKKSDQIYLGQNPTQILQVKENILTQFFFIKRKFWPKLFWVKKNSDPNFCW